MHVKICGLTNLSDARVAVEVGADLLGFNFYKPSPRFVEPEQAAYIIVALRDEFPQHEFHCVGVFVNCAREETLRIQQQCQLDGLQLHGDETVDDVRVLGEAAFKALRPKSAAEVEKWLNAFAREAVSVTPRFLVDSSHPSLYGGTGATGNWTIARDIAARYPILLAGGLTAENVSDAIRAVRPWGVDAASGVERAPGLKDAAKVRQFVAQAKRAE